MRSKQPCVRIKESSEGKMSVKICNMIDECNCGNSDCCAINEEGEDNGS